MDWVVLVLIGLGLDWVGFGLWFDLIGLDLVGLDWAWFALDVSWISMDRVWLC